MSEEILNSDGTRNYQANILLGNVRRLEQENLQLLEVNREYKNMGDTLLAEKNALQIACNELRKKNERLQKMTCPNCGEEMLTPSGAELYDKVLDYKQAFEEIKNIAELDIYYNVKLDKYTFSTYAQRILDTINEVLNDRD